MINTNLLLKSESLVKIYGELKTHDYELCTDSRKYKKGQLFYAIKGEFFDGFDFVENILEIGCPVVVFESNPKNIEKLKSLSKKETVFIEVKNTINYLQDISIARREEFQKAGGVIIGITGSNGKTTHKEMLGSLLKEVFGNKVLLTQGNLNNHIGVPLTLLSLEKEHEICVVEMGTNHPGEIKVLCDLADPEHGLITNIGASHLEFFKSEKNVYIEKRVLFDHVEKKNKGHFVVPADDQFLSSLSGKTLCSFKNHDRENGFIKTNSQVEIFLNKEKFSFQNENLGGDYNYSNMVSCLLLSSLIYPEHRESFLKAASSYTAPEMNRANWISKNKTKVFMDAYNANPSSMMAALDYFKSYINENNLDVGTVGLILGDMNELGEESARYHHEIGHWLHENGFKKVSFIGKFSTDYSSGFLGGDCFENVESFKASPPKNLLTSAYLFLKGSRSLQLESLLDIF